MTETIKILSIETSADICSVCISENDRVLLEYNAYEKNMHDELLAEFSKRIINDSHFEINNIDAVAVSAGPGSFTGLRIGAAFAKALCFDGEPQLIAIPTLKAIANNFLQIAEYLKKSKVSALIPSHKELIYKQDYDINGNNISEIVTIERDKLTQSLDIETLYCGPAADKMRLSTFGQLNFPKASVVAKVAYKYYLENKFSDAEKFVPHYIQEFVPRSTSKKLNI